MTTAGRACAAALLALALGGTAASGQLSSSVTASVTVDNTALTIDQMRDLTFGAVPAGVTTTILPKDATSGLWEIHGVKNAEIQVGFSLPAVLRGSLNPATYSFPIAFSATSACHRDRNQQNACTAFDPAAGVTQRLRNQNAPNNTFFIWLGAAITPAANQQPGSYDALITLTVTYTGN